MSGPWSNVHYSYRTCSERDPLGEREEPLVFENERLAWDFARERGLSYGPRKRIVRRAEGWVWTRGRTIPKAVPLPPVNDPPLKKRSEPAPKLAAALLFRVHAPQVVTHPFEGSVDLCCHLEREDRQLSDPMGESGRFTVPNNHTGVFEYFLSVEDYTFRKVRRVHVWARASRQCCNRGSGRRICAWSRLV